MNNEVRQLVTHLQLLVETHLVDGDNREKATACLHRLHEIYDENPKMFDEDLMEHIKSLKYKISTNMGTYSKDGSMPRADYETGPNWWS